MVETEKRLGHEEAALRHVRAIHRERDGALELRDVVVAEVADDRDVELLRLLERDDAIAAPDERVAAEAALVDRLEQERRTRAPAQAEVGRERCQKVGVELGNGHRCLREQLLTKNDPHGVVGSSGAGCFGAVCYALRLPPRSSRHAHQIGVGEVISFAG